MKITAMLLSLALSTGTAFSSTVLLTSDPGTGTTTTFTDTGNNGFGNPGPVSLDGFSVTGNPQVTWGNAGYTIGNNGFWNQSWIATNDGIGSITFNLGGAYSLVGGLMNYCPDPGCGSNANATITALGLDGVTVIGTYDLETMAAINTPGATNGDAFRGIESSSADIGYLELSGDFILAHSLEVGGASTVPEPSSLLLIGTGLLGAVGVVRRKLAA
jgi:hypothetical protein